MKWILPRFGLILNIVGSLFIAFSFGKSIVETEEFDDEGNKVSTASFRHPKLFIFGIILLIVGFIVSALTMQT